MRSAPEPGRLASRPRIPGKMDWLILTSHSAWSSIATALARTLSANSEQCENDFPHYTCLERGGNKTQSCQISPKKNHAHLETGPRTTAELMGDLGPHTEQSPTRGAFSEVQALFLPAGTQGVANHVLPAHSAPWTGRPSSQPGVVRSRGHGAHGLCPPKGGDRHGDSAVRLLRGARWLMQPFCRAAAETLRCPPSGGEGDRQMAETLHARATRCLPFPRVPRNKQTQPGANREDVRRGRFREAKQKLPGRRPRSTRQQP